MAAEEVPSLAPQWLKPGGGGGGGTSRIVKASPADPGSVLSPVRAGGAGEVRSPPRSDGHGRRGGGGKQSKGQKPGGSRVLPPEPFPRKRVPEERPGDRGWGPSPTTPRGGGNAFASFDRNHARNGRSHALATGSADQGSPRHPAASPRHGFGGSPRHIGASPRSSRGNGPAPVSFSGAVFRTMSAPDQRSVRGGGGGSGGNNSNGDRGGEVWSALVSPTKAARVPSEASHGAEAWTSKLVEPPASLAAILTGAPWDDGGGRAADGGGKDGDGSSGGSAKGGYLGAASQSMVAGVNQAPGTIAAEEDRSRRELLAMQQSKLLVPVVSAAHRDRPRPKLKGTTLPVALKPSAPVLAAPALPRARSLPEEGSGPPVLGLKGRVLRASPAAAAARNSEGEAAPPAAQLEAPALHPMAAEPVVAASQQLPVLLSTSLAPAPVGGAVSSEQKPAVQDQLPPASAGANDPAPNGAANGPPPGFGPKPATPPPKVRNSFLRSLRSRSDSGDMGALPSAQPQGAKLCGLAEQPPLTVPPPAAPLSAAAAVDSAEDLATALATACLTTDDDVVPTPRHAAAAPAANGHLSNGPLPNGFAAPGFGSARPHTNGPQHAQHGFGAPQQGAGGVLGLPAEEEAFLRSLGWSEGPTDGGLSEAEVAAYRVRHSFAVR